MKQVYNPYLPLYEYVPDGEPRVFDGRLYVYGSHDIAGGVYYCPGDYVVWSAPVEDLTDWRYEGISYRKTQDPSNSEGKRMLWAPDVVRGVDGRYYLYYCLDFLPEIGVAVSDHPAGPFEFLGHVKYSPHLMNGKKLQEHLPFDPGVLVDDDGRVFLYYGFSSLTDFQFPDRETLIKMGAGEDHIERIESMRGLKPSEGGMVVELESDMVTMKEAPKLCIPGGRIAGGTSFEGHAFYEASSMRKVNGKYYYIYSSQLSHELCYAVSEYPDRGFVYGGTIVSNGDVGYQGRTKPVNMLGNNHGSIVQVGDHWYVFYHRQTHGTEFSRQGCAERIKILPDGRIPQVEITSCGLNGGPLIASGEYSAAIACHLTSENNLVKPNYFDPRVRQELPYIYEEPSGESEQDHIQYIANVTNGVSFGFKYFAFEDVRKLEIRLRGDADGQLFVYLDSLDSNPISATNVQVQGSEWTTVPFQLAPVNGVHALYFKFGGEGVLQVKNIVFGQDRK